MPKFNTQFELDVEDMNLIEHALHRVAADDDGTTDPRKVSDLLGRLHNQKVFYRPKGTYISG